MNKDDFNGIEVSIPDKDSVRKFDNLAKPIDKKIYNNSVQLETLSKLRDVILPKLMRGEVRVEDFSNRTWTPYEKYANNIVNGLRLRSIFYA